MTSGSLASGDTASLTQTFDSRNVGTTRVITPAISFTSGSVSNYALTLVTKTNQTITPRALTVSASGLNRVYDGTTAATVTLSDNRLSGDVFTDSYTAAAFADKHVANGNTVSVSGISISGTDAANYALANTTATTTANITARALTVSAHGINKIY